MIVSCCLHVHIYSSVTARSHVLIEVDNLITPNDIEANKRYLSDASKLGVLLLFFNRGLWLIELIFLLDRHLLEIHHFREKKVLIELIALLDNIKQLPSVLK